MFSTYHFPCKYNLTIIIMKSNFLMQAWSNGIYNSVKHLVLNHQKVERFSIAYFFCSLADAVIQSYREPSIYRSFSFREYQKQVQEDVKSTGNQVGLSRFHRWRSGNLSQQLIHVTISSGNIAQNTFLFWTHELPPSIMHFFFISLSSAYNWSAL